MRSFAMNVVALLPNLFVNSVYASPPTNGVVIKT
jgi:hypothetical protein